jgi:hypothetical protein
MHRLIGRLVATVGVDRAAAEKAVGIIVPSRRRDGADENIVTRIDRLSRVRTALQAAQTNSNSGDVAAGVRIAAAGTRLRQSFSGRAGAVPAVRRERFGYASQMAGEDAVGDSVGAIPGRLV